MTDFAAEFKEISRKLAKLETHIINLLLPIQGIHQIFTDPTELNGFLRAAQETLTLNIDVVSNKLVALNRNIADLHDSVKNIQNMDVVQTIGEIKYLGKKLHEIDRRLYKFEKNGIDRNLQLEISVDGVKVEGQEKLPKKRLAKKVRPKK